VSLVISDEQSLRARNGYSDCRRPNNRGTFPQSSINRQPLESIMKNLFNRFVREEEGQDLIEYGLLIGIITIACIVSIQAIGPKVGSYFSNLNATLP
jgi:pilus assembly protein Flp/PilA